MYVFTGGCASDAAGRVRSGMSRARGIAWNTRGESLR
jgi:hypothetical protein